MSKGLVVLTFLLGILVGIGSFVILDKNLRPIRDEAIKKAWQKQMVDCGCAAYNETTGEFYTINIAPAPIPGPDAE